MKKRVVIDAGHGGTTDSGAVYFGRQEKDDALKLALAGGDLLEDRGFDVMYTRVDDVYHTPYEKADMGNSAGADYFISIHRNAAGIPGTASGIMTLVYEDAGVNGRLARAVNEELEKTGYQDLGVVERPGLAVLRRTAMPAILIEAGFIDNPQDNQLFDQQFEAIAEAVADGVEKAVREEEKRELPVYYMVQTGAYRLRSLAEHACRASVPGISGFSGLRQRLLRCEGRRFFESGLCGGPGRRNSDPAVIIRLLLRITVRRIRRSWNRRVIFSAAGCREAVQRQKRKKGGRARQTGQRESPGAGGVRMNQEQKIERMKELIELLNRAGRAYYQESREIMSNFEYDRLYDELAGLERETKTVFGNSPTQNVGYEVASSLVKERHEKPMLSLNKTKSVEELKEWLGNEEGLLSWKMDGLTIVLTYEGGELRKAVTRGNGEIGEVITANARTFVNVPKTIPYTGQLVLRGEAVIRYSDFLKINEEIEEIDARYKNPRNLCSGSVRQLNSRNHGSEKRPFFCLQAL